MQADKRFSQGFFGSQIGDKLIYSSGMVVETLPKPHEWHSHDGYELVFVGEGSQPFEVEGEQNILHIPGGHFSIMKPNSRHRSKYGIFFPSTFYWLELNSFTKKSLSKSIYDAYQMKRMFDSIDHADKLLGRSSPLLVQLLNEYSQALRELSIKDPLVARSNKNPLDSSSELQKWIRTLLSTIIVEALRCFENPLNFKTNKYVVEARQYIIENYMCEINIHDVIKPLGVSEAYLYNVFKEVIGLTPNNYLLHLRLQKACEILINTQLSITRIALETGFSCSQYFSNVFKSYIGETPSKFRKRIKSGLSANNDYLV